MRDHYELNHGRPNSHAARFSQKDRAALLRWWTTIADNVRVLPKDLAREFPDTKSTVAALRMVVKLRKSNLKSARQTVTSRKRAPRRSAG